MFGFLRRVGVGGLFLRLWPPSTMWMSPLFFSSATTRDVVNRNDSIFSNLWLCAACWTCLMCHHELCPTSVSHHFSSLERSLGLVGENIYKKFTILIFSLILQNFALPGCFPYIQYCLVAMISPYLLLVGLLLHYVALFQYKVQGNS